MWRCHLSSVLEDEQNLFMHIFNFDCVPSTVLELGPQGEVRYDLSWESGRVEMD